MITKIFQNTFPTIPNLSLHPICPLLSLLSRKLHRSLLHYSLHEIRSNTRVRSGESNQPNQSVSHSPSPCFIYSRPVGGEAGWRRGSTRTSSVITSVATSANPSGSWLVDEALFKRGKGMTVKISLRNKDKYILLTKLQVVVVIFYINKEKRVWKDTFLFTHFSLFSRKIFGTMKQQYVSPYDYTHTYPVHASEHKRSQIYSRHQHAVSERENHSKPPNEPWLSWAVFDHASGPQRKPPWCHCLPSTEIWRQS